MRDHFGLKITISLAAVAAITAHLLWPHLKIDAITFGLVVVAVLPWLVGLIESAKLPGGWEITFRN